MEIVADTVSDIFLNGRKAVCNYVSVDGVTNVAESVTNLKLFDARKEAFSRYSDKLF